MLARETAIAHISTGAATSPLVMKMQRGQNMWSNKTVDRREMPQRSTLRTPLPLT